MNFLTIDLDYFTMTKAKNASSFVIDWIKKAPQTYLIDTHEKLVEFDLIPHNTTKIFNVDFHNDITANHNQEDYEDLDLNEGTWGNFVPKSVKEFVWLYPNKFKCVDSKLGICVPASRNPKDYHLNYKTKLGHNNIPNVINRLVICLSSHWGDPSEIMKDLNIPNWHKIKFKRIF